MRDYISYANDDLHARWNSKVEWAVDPVMVSSSGFSLHYAVSVLAMRLIGPMAGSTGLTIAWGNCSCFLGAATYVKAILMLLMLIHMTCLIRSSYVILTLTFKRLLTLMILRPHR